MQTWFLTGPVRLRENIIQLLANVLFKFLLSFATSTPLTFRIQLRKSNAPIPNSTPWMEVLQMPVELTASSLNTRPSFLQTKPLPLSPLEKKILISFPLFFSEKDTFFARVSVVEVVVLFELLCREECRLLVVREPKRLGNHQLHHNRVEITCFTVGTNCSFSYEVAVVLRHKYVFPWLSEVSPSPTK